MTEAEQLDQVKTETLEVLGAGKFVNKKPQQLKSTKTKVVPVI